VSLRRVPWRFLAVLVCAACMLRPLPASADPEKVSIGIYVGGIHNLDFSVGKFTADFWIWSVVDEDHASPLDTAYVLNEVGKSADPIFTVRKVGKRWDQRRIRADLWVDWEVERFPFDTQVLTITLEESVYTADQLGYVIDRMNSGIAPDLSIAGWSILGWDIRTEEASYASSFGDPANPNGTKFARVVFSLKVHRAGLRTFLDQTIGAFVSFGVLALSFRLLPIVPPIFGARMVIIVGAMFTATTSMRAFGSTYAFHFGETLPTRIYLLTLAAGFLAAFAAVIARYIVERGNEALALRYDRWCLVILTVAYVGMVSGEILHAVHFC
jgi:hypothetical protein